MSQNKSELQWIEYRFSWVNKKKITSINPNNDDYKCFHYTAIVALDYKKIEKICKEYQ